MSQEADDDLMQPSAAAANGGPAKKRTARAPSKSMSYRAGLVMPVSRVRRDIRTGNYATRQSPGAAVFIAAVLEYLTGEVLELAGHETKDLKKKRIDPKAIRRAIRNDAELDELMSDVTIEHGGVRQFVHPELLKKAKH